MIMEAFGISLCHMTVWRDMYETAEGVKKQQRWRPVRVLGIDGAYPLAMGKKRPVLVAVDLGSGKPVAIGFVDESSPDAVRRFIEPLVKRLGVSVIVTDDLKSYRFVAEKLDIAHQVCQFHVRRWVGRTLYELRETLPKEWVWVLDEIHVLLSDLPLEGSRRLFELWKLIPERQSLHHGRLSPISQLRHLLIRLSEHWPSYRLFDWQKDVPWTNNRTEQVIGKMKIRSRTVRGYKSYQGMWNALMLSGTGIDF